MRRPRDIAFLMSILGVALGASALAIAATGGAQKQSASSTASATTTLLGAQAATRYYNFHGTITSRSRGHWFQMHTTDNRSLRIYTNGRTRWDDCDWGDMSHGHHVSVRAYRNSGAWYASRMQNWNDWDNGHWDHGNNEGGEHNNGMGNGGGDWDD